MKIYVFGNKDDKKDKIALEVFEKLEKEIKSPYLASARVPSLNKEGEKVKFVEVKPNEDLPFEGDVVIMDVVWGLKEVSLISDIDKFDLGPKNSVHDFDLSFQLKYLKKLGKIKSVRIIGLPLEGGVDVKRVKEIIRKMINE